MRDPSTSERECDKTLLFDKFEMTDMKELHYFLGIEVIRTPDGIMISQQHYILNLLYKFGMAECKSVATPLIAISN